MITLDNHLATRLQERAEKYGKSVEDLLALWLDTDEDVPVELCHAVVSNMTSSIIVTDRDSIVTYVNPACETATGYTSKELIGRDANLLQGDDRDQSEREVIRDAIADGEPCNVILRNYRKDGSLFYNELIISPIKNHAGEVTHFVGVQRDVTSRIEAQQSLEESEARYRQVTELMSDYAYSIAVDGDGNQTIEWVTDSFERMTGYSVKDFNDPDQVRRTAHPDDYELLMEDQERLQDGKPVSGDYRCRTQDGSTLWLRITRFPYLNEDRQLIRFVGVARDVTHERQALDVAMESQERFWNLADQTPVLIWMTHLDQGAVYLNRAWREFTGRELHEELGFDWLENVHPDDRSMLMDTYNNAYERHDTFQATFRLKRHDTEYRWIRTTGVPRYTPSGEFEGYIGSAMEISDLVTAREKLERSNEELERRVAERTESLKDREFQYRILSEMSSDYAYSIRRDEDGTVVQEWMTSAIEDITGYSRPEIDELKYDIIHPEDRDYAYKAFEELWSRQTEKTIEGRIVRKDGGVRYLRTHARSIWDDEKQRVVRLVAGSTDVTEARLAQQALEESERRYRSISELATDYAYSFLVHPDGSLELEWMTDAFERWTGYDAHDFSAYELIELLIHEDDRPRIQQMVETFTKHARYEELEYRLLTKFGNTLYTHTILKSEWDDVEERVVRFVGVSRDITERKMAEEALRESEMRYRHLSEITSDYAFSFKVHEDRRLELEWVTDALGTITGFTEEDFADDKIRIKLIHPDYLDEWRNMISGLLDQPGTATVETEFVRKNGEPINMRLILRTVGTRRVERLLGAASDVHEKTLAERALRASEARYRAISELMSDYVYSFRVDEDRSLSLEWVTDSVERVTGYTPQEFAEEENRDNMVPPKYKSTMRQMLRQLLTGPRDLKFDLPLITKSGDERILQTYLRAEWDTAQERVERIIGAVADVTARELTAKALKESEERYRIISEAISDYAYSVRVEPDGTQRIEWVTDAFERMTGYPRAMLSTADQLRELIIYPDDRTIFYQAYENYLLREETTRNIRVRVVTRRGEVRHTETSLRSIHNGDGTIQVIGVVNDITERVVTQQALQESEQRYRLISESVSDYAYSLYITPDLSFELEWVTNAFERLTGYDPNDMRELDKWFPIIFNKADFPALEVFIRQLLRQEYSQNDIDVRMVTNFGEQRYIRFTVRTIWSDEENRVVRLIGVAKDITERRLAEEELRQSETRYRQVVETQTELISHFNLHTLELTFVNPAYCRFFGKSAEELIGTNILTTVPENERVRIEAYARDLYENPRVSENTGQVIAGDGSIRIIHWVDQIIVDDEGKPVEGQSIGSDITELVEAQEALSAERDLLSKIMTTSPVGILVVERSGEIRFFNDAFLDIMQLEPERLEGRQLSDWPLRTENGDIIPAEQRPFQTILRTGQPVYSAQYRLNLHDGTHKFLSISGVPMFDNDDMVARVLFNCEDITLRKRWENELQKSYEQQKELNDLKTQFVSMVSHEFRTPLTIILTSTGLLRLYGDGLTTDQLLFRLMKIDTQVTRLTHLLDDIAFINKGSVVGIPVALETIRLKDFIEETIAEVNMAYPENGGIVVKNPHAITTIETDENLLHHALINLLSNAIKYSPSDSEVLVTLSLEDRYFVLSVQDEGIGIPEAEQDMLFQTFQRASNVGTISGTGLGLAITKQCVERVDGQVSFTSKEGEGSEFVISIPVSTYSKNDETLS